MLYQAKALRKYRNFQRRKLKLELLQSYDNCKFQNKDCLCNATNIIANESTWTILPAMDKREKLLILKIGFKSKPFLRLSQPFQAPKCFNHEQKNSFLLQKLIRQTSDIRQRIEGAGETIESQRILSIKSKV